jgi:general secretion pathway protein D
MTVRRTLALLPLLALLACEDRTRPVLEPLPLITSTSGTAAARVNGGVGGAAQQLSPQISLAAAPNVTVPSPGRTGGGGGDISLNFADTDIRDVVAQILGGQLGENYTIDPAVRGTATLRTTRPVGRDDLLPILQTLLAQNGATLMQAGGVYRVLPNAAAANAPGLAVGGGPGGAGGSTLVIPLHYASAEELAKTLAPYVQNGGRIVADAGRNTLIITGEPATRQTLAALVAAFDVDILAGQSYALFPIGAGEAKDFTTSLQDAIRGQGGALANVVRVIPMARINSVLVVSEQPRYIEDVRRLLRLVERSRNMSIRSWHVYYLQNSRSNDIAYVLQQAFTPNNVTAQPTPQTAGNQGTASQQIANRGALSAGGGLGASSGNGTGSAISLGGSAAGSGGGLGAGAPAATPGGGSSPAPPSANPLLGGLDPTEGSGGPGGSGPAPDAMRIIPNLQNNALLIYATTNENDTVETMLRKLDILPLQVRIDATIAEVTLNDTLQYGTQFFFRAGIEGALSFGATATSFATGFPGFVLGGPNSTSLALRALQAVTKVNVLSSPQLLVVDNQPARLQVGALVPYLSQTAQSTVASGAPIVSSVNYQQTGVIMQVTPRVNSGGLVTLDITQEVSDVDPNVTTPGVNSPTFNERSITSRVVVQDGQTVGLAGLIRDSDSRDNRGIPWLKDIPLLGILAGSQNNNRVRTELLVLITPHVVHDQRDARALTEDLRDELFNAAAVRQQLQSLPASGSADPNAPLRRRLRLGQ